MGFLAKRSWWALFGVSLAAVLPVWIPIYPAMTDLPQHAAQIALLRNLHDPSFAFASLFRINWFTPYLFGYLLVYVLVPLCGIVAACKVVVSFALAALPIATAFLMRETDTDPFWAVLTIPGLYGFSYIWGFLNYLVAAPIGIVFLALAMRQARQTSLVQQVRLAILALFLFFCHAAVCAFFLLIAFLYIIAEAGSWKRAMRGVLPLGIALPAMAFWAATGSTSHPTVLYARQWTIGWDRVTGFIPRLMGVEFDLIHVALALIVLFLPLLGGARYSRRWTTWIPLIICLGVVMFGPQTAMNTAFVEARFVALFLPLYLIVFEASSSNGIPRRNWYRLGALVIALGWTGIVSAQASAIRSEERSFRDLVAHMQPGQRALSMVFDRGSRYSVAPVYLQFPSWYSALKSGMVDPNFALFSPELIVFRNNAVPRAKIGDFEWFPNKFRWDKFHGEQYRYFVVRAPVDLGVPLFEGATCRIILRYRSGSWWLYERTDECSAP